MCGIAGFTTPSSPGDTALHTLHSMLHLIRHRGPDESGCYVDEGLLMGTTRLAVVDLESGSQPLSDSTGRYWICFNGELYNHLELREVLQRQGRVFRTRSDTEVVLQAWIHWGEACLRRFNGAFAFAIRDAHTQTLVLARDRYGKRPLFYAEWQGAFLFASEVKTFLAYPGFQFELDARELMSTFATWTPLPDRSCFTGVRQLPMGGCLTVQGGHRTLQLYEELELDVEPFRGSEAEAAALVHDVLRESVRQQMRGDVPVGVYLSGGLDSTIVTRLVSELASTPARTFSVEFEDSGFDESEDQRIVVDHMKTRHSSIRVAGADIVEAFPRAVFHAEVPTFRTAFVPMYLLSRHVRDAGFKVVLSGEGADEAFLGYSLFRETLLRAAWGQLTLEEKRERVGKLHPYLAHFSPEHSTQLMGLFQQFAVEQLPGLFSHELRFQNGRFAVRLLKDRGEPFRDLQALVRETPQYGALSAVQKAQWLEFKTLLPGYLLSTQGERMSLAHGVENRCPFLDPEVIRTAASVNGRFGDELEEKALLKKAFQGQLPARSVARHKHPYRAPGSAVFAQHRPDYLDLVLSDTELRKLDCVEPVFARRLTQKILSVPPSEISTKEDQAFMLLLSTAMLHHQFIDGGARAALPREGLNALRVFDQRAASRRGGLAR